MSNFKDNARFSDIRVGDTIRHQWTSSGVAYTRVGTVTEIRDGLAYTADGGELANKYTDHYDSFTTDIVDRPEPEWKPGDLALDAEDRAWGMDEDGYWNSVVSHLRYHGTEALAESFGPLRRAKVVEADQ